MIFFQHLEKENILDKKHRSQFANRLIGRIIFCWFLRKKEIISEEVGYFDADGKPAIEYYSKKLEVLFFKVLNTPLEERGFGIDDKTPFLNGGLFEEKESDLAGRGELSFPADYFERFYSFLNRYNFTTDESTSDFQQVAIDPEMLGRIFENLLAEEIEETGEQARKAKGAFYTPREIVDYMCRESLRAYVSEKMGEDARKNEVLQLLFDKKEHELDPKSVLGKLGSYKSRIIEALDEIKIIDPACGSGAFPIGMLQIMLSIYERLDSRLDHYKTKLIIIKNNIFGVDIEPMAVEISRLRTWLSLIVDEEVNPREKNRGIDALPNLDFKFVCANSLIPIVDDKGSKDPFDTLDVNKLLEIRDKYFNARSYAKKQEYRKQYEKILKKGSTLLYSSQRQKQIETYHPFDSDNVCSFFDGQFMFGVDKFGVAIANPPYGLLNKRQNKTAGHLAAQEQVDFYKTFPMYAPAMGGMVNVFRLFLVRSVDLLKEGGFFSEIFPLAFAGDLSTAKLREYFLKNYSILSIEAFPERDNESMRVFQGAKISVCILNLRKDKLSDSFSLRINSDRFVDVNASKVFLSKKDLELVDKKNLTIPIIKSEDFYLIKKIYAQSIRLDDIGHCYTGEVDLTFYKKYLTNNTLDAPLIKGAIVDRFLIRKKMSQGDIKFLDLSGIKHDGKKLRDSHGKSRRIVMQGITGVNEKIRIKATLINEGVYCANSVNYIIQNTEEIDPYYILGFLNSSLLNYIFSKYSTNSNVNGYEVDNLPFKFSKEANKLVVDRVKKILLISKSNICGTCKVVLESSEAARFVEDINNCIMDLYGLTQEEREIIYNS